MAFSEVGFASNTPDARISLTIQTGSTFKISFSERKTAEEKLTKTELNLAKTGDRADILESSHRVIQDELAEERQNSQMLTAELTRERATRKTIEETIESHQKALEFERQRVDGQLARLAKRMDENHQELSTALRERTLAPVGEFATNPY